MAKFSTGLRNGMLGSTGAKEALNGGRLRIFSVTAPALAPATADAPETGVLLMELTVAGDGVTGLTFGVPDEGVLSKTEAEVWMTSSILASGAISYFRFVAPGDTGAASATQARIQGSVGVVGTDMVLASTAATAGQPWTLNYFNVALPTLA